MRKVSLICIAVLMSFSCLFICGCSDKSDELNVTDNVNQTSGVAHHETNSTGIKDNQGAVVVPNQTENDAGIPKYCTLKYPEKYIDDVLVTECVYQGGYTTLFTAKLAEGNYDLFSVSFGEGGEGELFGYLYSGESKVPVYIKCYSLPSTHSLTEEQTGYYFEMMEAINTVSESISSADGFTYS